MSTQFQKVNMVVCALPTPTDTSAVEAAIEQGTVKVEALVAVVGKVDGTGMQKDYGRELADLTLRQLLSRRLGVPRDDLIDRISMILSGGCPGVIAPHVTLITKEWEPIVIGEEHRSHEKALVIGRSRSETILPEEIGRMGQIHKVAEATKRAMKDAGIDDMKDVHQVMVKGPTLTRRTIQDALRRGQTVVSLDTSAGPSGALCYANDGAALGVALALGEVRPEALSDDVVRRDWSLYSEVAATSSGGEKTHAEVLLLGNSLDSASELRVGHGVMGDLLDVDGVKNALRSAGLVFDCCPSARDRERIVQVFAKSIVPGSDLLRGKEITLLDDADASKLAKAVGGAVVAGVVGNPMIFLSGGEFNSHQGPPNGSPIAAVVRLHEG
jgi:cyanuric acid amidohydrolase